MYVCIYIYIYIHTYAHVFPIWDAGERLQASPPREDVARMISEPARMLRRVDSVCLIYIYIYTHIHTSINEWIWWAVSCQSPRGATPCPRRRTTLCFNVEISNQRACVMLRILISTLRSESAILCEPARGHPVPETEDDFCPRMTELRATVSLAAEARPAADQALYMIYIYIYIYIYICDNIILICITWYIYISLSIYNLTMLLMIILIITGRGQPRVRGPVRRRPRARACGRSPRMQVSIFLPDPGAFNSSPRTVPEKINAGFTMTYIHILTLLLPDERKRRGCLLQQS